MRHDSRAIRPVERLAERPTASILGACSGWAETQEAYRFLSGEEYDWMDILEPHRQCTRACMAQRPVVLCLQETTELDFNGQAIVGLGPLSYEAQRGAYLHPTFGVSPAREPLGVLDPWIWAHEPKAPEGTRPGVKECCAGATATRVWRSGPPRCLRPGWFMWRTARPISGS